MVGPPAGAAAPSKPTNPKAPKESAIRRMSPPAISHASFRCEKGLFKGKRKAHSDARAEGAPRVAGPLGRSGVIFRGGTSLTSSIRRLAAFSALAVLFATGISISAGYAQSD